MLNVYPLLAEVVGVVLQIRRKRCTKISVTFLSYEICQESVFSPDAVLNLETTNKKGTTYNFHTLSAWWLRDGVFDEAMGGKVLHHKRK